MSARLITAEVWSALSAAARGSTRPAYVAVAYFGKGASNLLSLPSRSRLVVDCSEGAVKSGQTHPHDLLRMLRRSVDVYSAKNLHAKVFAFDKTVFIGSANVSNHPANVLREAVVRISDPTVVQQARTFVKELCLEPLGPEELKRLQKLYKPPQFSPGVKTNRSKTVQFSALRVASTKAVDVSDKLEAAFEAGRKEASRSRRRGFVIEEFYWGSPSPFRDGQLVIQVHRTTVGRSVSPPGHVIHVRQYRNGQERKTLIYVELPNQNWKPLSRFGKAAKKLLARGGLKNQSATKALLALW